MIKLNLYGAIEEVIKGLNYIKDDINISLSEKGIPLYVKKSNCMKVSLKNGQGEITYQNKVEFFRLLGLFLEKIVFKKNFVVEEKPNFNSCGIAIDCSRNSVPTVKTLKKFLRKLAFMGLNMAMLYTEDTYELEDYPCFGYMRGRYSKQELKAIDDYAHDLGIELIPFIQTLSHLEKPLRWPAMSHLKDTNRTLLCEDDKVYEFIESMVKSTSESYRSKKIFIGMDEATDIGLGRYLKINGYKKGYDIMTNHLNHVTNIISKYNLKAMICSDMYFRLASKSNDYYDTESVIPQDVIDSIPRNIDIVYWDYYHDNEEFYESMIKKHQLFGNKIVFAGGIWTWTSPGTWYGKTFKTTIPALKQCIKHGIKDVICTLWMDNSAESNINSAFLAIQLYAEYMYKQDVDFNHIEKRFEFCIGANPKAFLDIGKFDGLDYDVYKESEKGNITDMVLFQDPLVALFDDDIKDLNLSKHYENLIDVFAVHKKENPEYELLFAFYENLARVLSQKSELGLNITKAYKSKNMINLDDISQMGIETLICDIERLKTAWMDLWFDTYKAFGFEILDICIGGLISRLKTTQKRIQQYIKNEIDNIEELEQERLPLSRHGDNFSGVKKWSQIISANNVY